MSTLDIAMTATEATQVTSRIKLLLGTIAENTTKVVALIEQAESGKAWRALDYPSWTAYVAAEFSDALAGLQRAERVPITAKLSGTGMSTRAIASVTGTSVGTVHNDIVAAGVQELNTCPDDDPALPFACGQPKCWHEPVCPRVPTTVKITSTPEKRITGRDGKEYVRNGRPTAGGMQELANAVPEPRKAPRRRPLPEAYRDAVYDLEKVVERLQRLTGDDRFAGNAEALYEREGARLERVAQALHDKVCMPLVRGGGDQ